MPTRSATTPRSTRLPKAAPKRITNETRAGGVSPPVSAVLALLRGIPVETSPVLPLACSLYSVSNEQWAQALFTGALYLAALAVTLGNRGPRSTADP